MVRWLSKSIASILLLACTGQALAAGSAGTAQKITVVKQEGTTIFITGTQAFSNPDACTINTTLVVTNATDTPNQDWWMASLLSALSTGQKMAFYLQGCTTIQGGTAPRAATFWIYAP